MLCFFKFLPWDIGGRGGTVSGRDEAGLIKGRMPAIDINRSHDRPSSSIPATTKGGLRV